MQYKRFEDLPVWQDAADLARSMYEFTALDRFRLHPGLRDPLERRAFGFQQYRRGIRTLYLADRTPSDPRGP